MSVNEPVPVPEKSQEWFSVEGSNGFAEYSRCMKIGCDLWTHNAFPQWDELHYLFFKFYHCNGIDINRILDELGLTELK